MLCKAVTAHQNREEGGMRRRRIADEFSIEDQIEEVEACLAMDEGDDMEIQGTYGMDEGDDMVEGMYGMDDEEIAAMEIGGSEELEGHDVFDEYDMDSDGFITRDEWDGSDVVFDAIDTDGDGMITYEEAMIGLGESFSKMASKSNMFPEDDVLMTEDLESRVGGTTDGLDGDEPLGIADMEEDGVVDIGEQDFDELQDRWRTQSRGEDMDEVTENEHITASKARIASATKRLDRVASYLEKTGRKQLAKKLDMISDSLEKRVGLK
jgi:hypothetical protein